MFNFCDKDGVDDENGNVGDGLMERGEMYFNIVTSEDKWSYMLSIVNINTFNGHQIEKIELMKWKFWWCSRETLPTLFFTQEGIKRIIRWKLQHWEGRNKSRLPQLFYSFVMCGCWKGNCEATRKCWRMQQSRPGLDGGCDGGSPPDFYQERGQDLSLRHGQTGLWLVSWAQPHCISTSAGLAASTRTPPPPHPGTAWTSDRH